MYVIAAVRLVESVVRRLNLSPKPKCLSEDSGTWMYVTKGYGDYVRICMYFIMVPVLAVLYHMQWCYQRI